MTKRHSGLSGARQEQALLSSRKPMQACPSASVPQAQVLPVSTPTPTATKTVATTAKGKIPAGLANYLANKKAGK